MNEVNKNIKWLREIKNISTFDFAEMLGISEKTLHSYEEEGVVPEMDIILKLCDIFDIKTSVILNEDMKSKKINPSFLSLKQNEKTGIYEIGRIKEHFGGIKIQIKKDGREEFFIIIPDYEPTEENILNIRLRFEDD